MSRFSIIFLLTFGFSSVVYAQKNVDSSLEQPESFDFPAIEEDVLSEQVPLDELEITTEEFEENDVPVFEESEEGVVEDSQEGIATSEEGETEAEEMPSADVVATEEEEEQAVVEGEEVEASEALVEESEESEAPVFEESEEGAVEDSQEGIVISEEGEGEAEAMPSEDVVATEEEEEQVVVEGEDEAHSPENSADTGEEKDTLEYLKENLKLFLTGSSTEELGEDDIAPEAQGDEEAFEGMLEEESDEAVSDGESFDIELTEDYVEEQAGSKEAEDTVQEVPAMPVEAADEEETQAVESASVPVESSTVESAEQATQAEPEPLAAKYQVTPIHAFKTVPLPAQKPVNIEHLLVDAYKALLADQAIVAVNLYKQALFAAPDNVDALFGAGAAYHRAHQYEKAFEYYINTLKQKPDHADSIQNIVLVAEKIPAEKQLQGLKELEEAISEKNLPVELAESMASLYLANNQFSQALPYLKKAVNNAPNNIGHHYNLAITYDQLGKVDDAIAHYQIVISGATKGQMLPGPIAPLELRLNYLKAQQNKASQKAPVAASGS